MKKLFRSIPSRLLTLSALFLAALLPLSSLSAAAVRLEGSVRVANVTAGDTRYERSVDAKYDEVVKIQVFYHNRESEDSGKVAEDLRVKIDMPSQPGKSQVVNASIKGNNTNEVKDQTHVNLDRDDAYLEYIPGSAVWRRNVGTNTNVKYEETKISDAVVTSGQGLRLENAKPCYNFSATVTVLARVRVSGIKVDKTVRVKGTTEWKTQNTAKPGDILQYQIRYENAGNTQHRNVLIRDNLPPGVSYVKGSSKLLNSGGAKDVSDGVTTTGIIVGTYNPGAVAYVMFEAKLSDAKDLKCGKTEFRNVGVARPEGMNEYYNTAITVVEKKCEEKPVLKQPVCDALDVKKLGGRKIQATVRYSSNDATFKSATFDFGDGSNPVMTDQATVEHEYAQYGSYTISTRLHFTLDGKDVYVQDEACVSKVSFEKPTKPGEEKPDKPSKPGVPEELPVTGFGGIAGIFAATSAAGTAIHYAVNRRRS